MTAQNANEISAREMSRITGYSEGRIQKLRAAGVIKSTQISPHRMVTLRADFEAYWSGTRPVGDGIDLDALAEKIAAKLAQRITVQVVIAEPNRHLRAI